MSLCSCSNPLFNRCQKLIKIPHHLVTHPEESKTQNYCLINNHRLILMLCSPRLTSPSTLLTEQALRVN
jgi:hypothetical protein